MSLTDNSTIILKKLREVSDFVGDCDDWVTIKKELIKLLPSSVRSKFSRRHPITKEQQTNKFEYELINYYKEMTGISLVIRTLSERRKINES